MKQLHLDNLKARIPKEVLDICKSLDTAGFESYIVGGSIRDLILGLTPDDWDITTNAKPEEILAIFPRAFYENNYGTVGIVPHETEDLSQITENIRTIEITPYRKEGKYTDSRRPDDVTFTDKIEDDLSRRDFTVNAIAYDPIKDIIKDMHNGIKDIENDTLKTVGNPEQRFTEDNLRLLRAVRIATKLNFSIESNTLAAIVKLSANIETVSLERIRDEFIKLFKTRTPMVGFIMLQYTGLLKHIMPELELGMGVRQTANHAYDVWGHLLRSMQHAADKDFSLDLHIAALLHDIAKPHTARLDKNTGYNTFYGHEVVGARVARQILERLKFPAKQTDRIVTLIRWHMFNSDPDQITDSAVRRMIVNVGRENIWDLMNLRLCDRIGSGRPVEEPQRLRRYYAMLEKALQDPIDLKMLKINGQKIMEVTNSKPGPKLGLILNALMGEVLENPALNTEDILVSRATILMDLDIETLRGLAKKGIEGMDDREEEGMKAIKSKFRVR
jgi:tRNA nucleotidyltransferase (CCA-adding enzyme)